MKLAEPSIDQLRIFLAVEEAGSFGGAARAMGRAVSAISYGIAQMEERLGVTLFARQGSRRPVLTDAGRGILPEAKAIAERSDALLAKTRSLHAGLESELSLVIDVMVPGEITAGVLREFRTLYPTVILRLQIEGLGAVAACLLAGEADFAIGGPVTGDLPGLEREVIGGVELIPVAAPGHPLARPDVAPGESRGHLQLVLADRSDLTRGQDFSVLSLNTWRLGDLGAKHALLKAGTGWGNMPRPMVAGDLASGALVALDLPEKPGAHYPFSAIRPRGSRPGPAAGWLVGEFRRHLQDG